MALSLRPIGWICGELVRKFAGQAEVIQRAVLEIIDEIRDEFPNLLRLTHSNEERSRNVQESGSVMARVFSSAHGAIIMNGLNRLSESSKSIAKIVQPQLARKLTELNKLSHRLFKTLNTSKKPLYKMKDKTVFFYDMVSYPAKTALTSVMYVSYAALMFLAISIKNLLAKISGIIQTEQASRETSSEGVDEDGFPRATELTSPTEQVLPELTSKASHSSGSIHTLLSAMDQESEN